MQDFAETEILHFIQYIAALLSEAKMTFSPTTNIRIPKPGIRLPEVGCLLLVSFWVVMGTKLQVELDTHG